MTTKEQVEQRLSMLKAEYSKGEEMLADLRTKQINLQETLLRIDGAIQVLEELLQESPPIEQSHQADVSIEGHTHAISKEVA